MDSLEKNNLKDLKNFFSKRSTEIKSEKDQILSIIGPHLEKIDNSTLSELDKGKNKKGLIDLGKFLMLFDDSIVIEEAIREYPNFLIRDKSKKIGLELRDLYSNTDAKKNEDTIETIFREIEDELKKSSPDTKGVFKIDFKEKASFVTQKKDIKEEITHYIKTSEAPLNYVKEIVKKPGDTLHLHTSEATSVGPSNKAIVLESLAKKDGDLASHKTSANVSEIWLLLVLDGSKDASDYSSIDTTIIEDLFINGFDKALIFDFSKSKIIELKRK